MTIRLFNKADKTLKITTLTVALMCLCPSLIGQTAFSGSITDPIERARQAVTQNNNRVAGLRNIQVADGEGSPAATPTAASTIQTDTLINTDEVSTADGDEKISLNVDDQEIRVILRNIAELFELNIVIPEDLEGRTSLNLRDVTWQQVFSIVLEEKGYSWIDENGIIRIRRGGFDVGSDEEGDTRVQVLEDGLLKVDFRSTPIDGILSVVASALDLNVVVPPDEALSSELDLRLNRVSWEQVFTVSLAQFGYGYIDQDGIVMIQSLDQINGVPDISRVFQVKYSEAESIAELLKEQAGVARVVTDSRSNVIIVTGNPSRFPEIKALIDTLDRPTPQVMIESRFVEVSNKDTKQIGVDWQSLFADEGYGISGSYGVTDNRTRNKENSLDNDSTNVFGSNNTIENGTNTLNSNVQSTINQVQSLLDSTVANRSDTAIFSAPAFNIVLRALKKLDDSKIISNPTVLALNGQEAEIKIVDHYHVQKPGTVAEGGIQTQGEIEKLDPLPGIELKVTPNISGGDFISLKVIPQVNDIVGTQTLSGTPIPVVRQRTTQTHVMVKDRETLAIGGLIDESNSTESSKVPILGSVPGLGRLFRYDKEIIDSQNQIIFITASILNPNETSYIDVVGLDRLNHLGLTDRDVMGANYPVSPEEQALNEAIMDFRRKTEKQEKQDKLNLQLEAYRQLEEERILKALEELEKKEDLSLSAGSENRESAAMEELRKLNRHRPVPVF